MRFAPRAILAGGLGFAASCLVACGGGGSLLSIGDASSLSGQLDAVSSALAQRQCAAAQSAAAGFSQAVQQLGGVADSLRNNLSQGAITLNELATQTCPTTQATRTTKPTTASTSTTVTSTRTTTPTTSSTTTPSTSSSTTTPATTSTSSGTTSTTSSSGGAGLGGGTGSTASTGTNGNGNGNGQ
jgi:hypothetical protein